MSWLSSSHTVAAPHPRAASEDSCSVKHNTLSNTSGPPSAHPLTSCRTRAEPHTPLLPILRAAVLQPKAKGKAKTGIKLSGTHMRSGQENAPLTGVCEGMPAQRICCSTAAGGTWLLMQAGPPSDSSTSTECAVCCISLRALHPLHVLTHGCMS